MKRIIRSFLTAVLLWSLVLGTLFSAHGADKRLYVDLNAEEGGLYRADLCWEGAQLSDDIGGIRIALSYDRDAFSVEKFELGDALGEFSIRMGPQDTESYPLIFLGASGTGPVAGEGVLGSVWLKAKPGVTKTALIGLELLEAVRFSDNEKLSGVFSVESLEVRLDASGAAEINPVAVTSPFVGGDDGTHEPIAPNDPDTPVSNGDPDGLSSTDTDPAPNESELEKDGALPVPENGEISAVGADPAPTGDPALAVTLIVAGGCLVLAFVVTALFLIVRRRRKAEEAILAETTPEDSKNE